MVQFSPVESSWSHERLVEDVDPVGSSEHDNVSGTGVESVHLDQKLVERVLRLALSTEVAPAALPSHRVDFVNEQDARGVLPVQYSTYRKSRSTIVD